MIDRPRRVLVDANIIIYSLLGSPLAEPFRPYLVGSSLIACFQTVGEVWSIALRRGWGGRRLAELENTLATFAVIESDAELTRAWAVIMSEQLAKGSPIQAEDAWIAAVARVYELPILTNDRTDFERIEGLDLLPP